MKVTLTTLNAKFIHSSLALRYLREACREKGIQAEVREYTINLHEYDILSDLYEQKSDIVGFACYIWNIEETLHVAELLHQVAPETILVLGGPEVSYTAKEILKEYPYIRYVVQGEGEESFVELIQTLKEGRIPEHIPGVLGWHDGRLIGNETVCEVKDLSRIPFPYRSEGVPKLDNKIMYYESSRGCPFQCQYCLSGNRNTVRFFPADRVISELKEFVAAGVKQIKFVDRTFNCNPAHHRRLLEYMRTVTEPINFHLEIAADLLKEEDIQLLKAMPKGRVQLEIGIQSSHEETLKAIRRHNEWSVITRAVAALREAGNIHLHLDLIVGLPYEGARELQKSFHDIYVMKPHALQIGFLKLLKGSGIQLHQSAGYKYDKKAPYEVLETPWLSYETVRFWKVLEDVFERVHNSGKFVRYIEALEPMYADNYFVLYEKMTRYWQQQGLHQISVGDQRLIEFLQGFAGTYHEDKAELLLDMLRLDVLSFFGFKVKPAVLAIEEAPRSATDIFYRDEARVRRYIPDYVFTDWKKVKGEIQIVRISADTVRQLWKKECSEPAYALGHKGEDGSVTWYLWEEL